MHQLRKPKQRVIYLLVAAAYLGPPRIPFTRINEIAQLEVGLGEEEDRPRILGVASDLGQQLIAFLLSLTPEQVAVGKLMICAVVLVFEGHIDPRVVPRSGVVGDILGDCRQRAVQNGGLVASGENLVAPFGEFASRGLVAEELHTAIDQSVVVRERDAGLQVALQCRIGATLGDHRAPVGEQIGNARDFEDLGFPVVQVKDDLRACDPGIAVRAENAR